MSLEYKTSEQWEKDVRYAGLQILDPDGWDRRPEKFEHSFFVEKITKQEFERRLCSSTVIWSLPKL